MIAQLTVIAGPMFAGKTSALIGRIVAALEHDKRPVVILTPSIDTRYARGAIVTHDGVARPATPIACEEDVFKAVAEASARAGGPAHVFIDETNFLDPPHFRGEFHMVVHALLLAGHDVTCCGLDTDWRGHPFETTARLLAMADHVEKLTARCTVTGLPAQKTYKKHVDASRIALGAAETYEARANVAWEGMERTGEARVVVLDDKSRARA
jgi:thymidine kinase